MFLWSFGFVLAATSRQTNMELETVCLKRTAIHNGPRFRCHVPVAECKDPFLQVSCGKNSAFGICVRGIGFMQNASEPAL